MKLLAAEAQPDVDLDRSAGLSAVAWPLIALPGIAVAFACWMGRNFHSTLRVSAGIIMLLAGWGVITQWLTVRHPETIDRFNQQTQTLQYLELEPLLD